MLSQQETNLARFVGTLATEPEVDHRIGDNVFYKCNLQVQRTSGTCDTIPLLLGERKLNQLSYRLRVGMRISVSGMVCTYNVKDGERTHLKIYVLVSYIDTVISEELNEVILSGYLCKQPIFRRTPFGKEITDIMLACNFYVSENKKRVAYIPCIAWNRLARDISYMEVGDAFNILGRFQSREYLKKLPDGSSEIRTAYEVSIMELI